MTQADDTTAGTVREVEPEGWGRVILEDILFRAARQVSADAASGQPAPVVLEFQVIANAETGAIEITTAGAVEAAIVTCLPL